MDFLVKPWQHQLQAFNMAKGVPFFGLLFEQGCGKTSTLINILRYKFAVEKRILTTVIFCPPIVIENWKREWMKYSRLHKSQVVPLVGSQKERVETLTTTRLPAIFVTNYESLMMKDLFREMKRIGCEVVVADESQRIKNRKANRTKKILELSERSRFRYILSGTAMTNGPEDLYSQIYFLDRGKIFGQNFHVFLHRYFEDINADMPKESYFPNWVLKQGSKEAIGRAISGITMRVKKEECMDLPPLVRQQRFVHMTKEQVECYERMKDDFIAFLGSEACVGDLAITRGLRLQQIVSGFMPLENGQVHYFKENPRLDALEELLKDLTPNHKVIVWAVFHSDYDQIRNLLAKLKIKFVEVTGAVGSSEKRRANVDIFNNDPSCLVFLGNQRAGGIGVNLVASDVSIFYSRNFSLEDDQQAEARNHRGGSEIHKKVTRIDLVCPETIDELCLTALSQKKNISEAILKSFKDKL